MSVLAPQISTLARLQSMRITGRVATLRGLTLLVQDLPLPVGSLVAVAGAREVGTSAKAETANTLARSEDRLTRCRGVCRPAPRWEVSTMIVATGRQTPLKGPPCASPSCSHWRWPVLVPVLAQ